MEPFFPKASMARIENTETREVTYLRAYHLFGRNNCICNTSVQSNDVSRSHATIYWSCDSWYLQDHSRNGTLVDGRWIRKSSVKLERGSQLRFGNTHAPLWRIIEAGPPAHYLRSVRQPSRVLPLDACHALPSEQQPEVVLYQSGHKCWVAEWADRKIELHDGTRFTVHGEEWEFVENDQSFDTVDYGQVSSDICFKFYVSANEEDIRLKLIANGEEYDLGRRAYNYLLLALTRKRLKDLDLGFANEDQGWVSMDMLEEDVSRELGHEVDAYYLNLQIYRLRKTLMEMKPFGHLFANVIERRTGELRLAFPKLKVVKEDRCIGEIVC